jgi:hypothetical protein
MLRYPATVSALYTVGLLIALLLLSASAHAQTVPLHDPDPALLVAAGVDYNRGATPQFAGWTSIAFAASPGLYSITTLDQTLRSSSLRSGAAKKLFERGGFTFLLHMDAGVTITASGASSSTAGSLSAGPMIAWQLPKLKNVYAVAVVRFVASTASAVKPLFELGFAWGI